MSEEKHEQILAALGRIQQQLQFLEKKVDGLVQQSQQRPPFNRDRNFSRPFRPFGNRPNRPEGQGNFGHGGGKGNFAPKKKFFGGNRDRH